MTEEERRKKEIEEEEKKRRKKQSSQFNTSDMGNKMINEDGTLAAFGFNSNYQSGN